jgi:isopentenyl-diphosphate delta-isomerase
MHEQRKSEHLRIALEESVSPEYAFAGFDRYRFQHLALPEIDLAEVSVRTEFLGHTLAAPLLISSMTGGTPAAAPINQRLAIAAQSFGLALALGSVRAAIEDSALIPTFQVREWAPDVLLLCNLGAVQLGYGYGYDECMRAVEITQANALVLHLNPLQEALQPGGNTRFSGLLAKIEGLARSMPLPIVVKEVGWGISGDVAKQLINCGVAAIDVAGAGGTSWSKVESLRTQDESRKRIAADFRRWGIPTAESIRQVRHACPGTPLVGSGGVRSGIDLAKAIALGADIGGVALPLLRAASESQDALDVETRRFVEGLRITMFCIGTPDLRSLGATSRMYFTNGSAEQSGATRD